MFNRVIAIGLVLLGTIPLCGQPHARIQRLQVHFLATSTSIHGKEAGSEDVYLVELTDENGRIGLARLVDQYPDYRLPLSRAAISSSEGQHLQLLRDPACDVALKNLPLRTAPGDPVAVLPERLRFEPNLPPNVAQDAPLPCFRVVRK